MSAEKNQSSTEQKKSFKVGGGAITYDHDNGSTNQELSSCFTNALNMALS